MIRHLWPAITWSIVVLILTLIPGNELPDVQIVGIDKIVHVCIFGVLMILTSYGLYKLSSRRAVLIAILYTCAFGITIELIQPFVPGRSFSYFDIIANTLGAAFGYMSVIFLRTRYF